MEQRFVVVVVVSVVVCGVDSHNKYGVCSVVEVTDVLDVSDGRVVGAMVDDLAGGGVVAADVTVVVAVCLVVGLGGVLGAPRMIRVFMLFVVLCACVT